MILSISEGETPIFGMPDACPF